VNRH